RLLVLALLRRVLGGQIPVLEVAVGGARPEGEAIIPLAQATSFAASVFLRSDGFDRLEVPGGVLAVVLGELNRWLLAFQVVSHQAVVVGRHRGGADAPPVAVLFGGHPPPVPLAFDEIDLAVYFPQLPVA